MGSDLWIFLQHLIWIQTAPANRIVHRPQRVPAHSACGQCGANGEHFIDENVRDGETRDLVKSDQVPADFDFASLEMSKTAKEKLSEHRPTSVGAAMRIPGINLALVHFCVTLGWFLTQVINNFISKCELKAWIICIFRKF